MSGKILKKGSNLYSKMTACLTALCTLIQHKELKSFNKLKKEFDLKIYLLSSSILMSQLVELEHIFTTLYNVGWFNL